MEELEDHKNILDIVAEMADFANAVASMVVGHRKILVEGGFDVNLSDQMAAALHAQMLGLVHHFEEEPDFQVLEFLVGNDEDEDDE